MAAIAYYILQQIIMASQGPQSILRAAIGPDWKGKLSPLLYLAAIGLSFVNQWFAVAIYVAAALLWLVPDRRVERTMTERRELLHEHVRLQVRGGRATPIVGDAGQFEQQPRA